MSVPKLSDAVAAASIAEGIEARNLPNDQDATQVYENLAALSAERQRTIVRQESAFANEIDPKAKARPAQQKLDLQWANKENFFKKHFPNLFGKTKAPEATPSKEGEQLGAMRTVTNETTDAEDTNQVLRAQHIAAKAADELSDQNETNRKKGVHAILPDTGDDEDADVQGSGTLKTSDGKSRVVEYFNRTSLFDHMFKLSYELQDKAKNTEGTKGILKAVLAGVYTLAMVFIALPLFTLLGFGAPWTIRWDSDTKVEVLKSSDTNNLKQAAADGSEKAGAALDVRLSVISQPGASNEGRKSVSAVRGENDLSGVEEEVERKTAADAQSGKSVKDTAVSTMTLSQKIRSGLSRVLAKFSKAQASDPVVLSDYAKARGAIRKEVEKLVDSIVDEYQLINRQVQGRSRFYDKLGNEVQADAQGHLTNLVNALAKHANGATPEEQFDLYGFFTGRLAASAGDKKLVNPSLLIVDRGGEFHKDALIQDEIYAYVVQHADDFRNAFGEACEKAYVFALQNGTPAQATEELLRNLNGAVAKGFMTNDQIDAVLAHVRDSEDVRLAQVQAAVDEIKKDGNKQAHSFGDELVQSSVLNEADQPAFEQAVEARIKGIQAKKALQEKAKLQRQASVAKLGQTLGDIVQRALRTRAMAKIDANLKTRAQKARENVAKARRALFDQFNERLAQITNAQRALKALNRQYGVLVDTGERLEAEYTMLENILIDVQIFRPEEVVENGVRTVSPVAKETKRMTIGQAIEEIRIARAAIQAYPGAQAADKRNLTAKYNKLTQAVRSEVDKLSAKGEEIRVNNASLISFNDKILEQLAQVDAAIAAYKEFASKPRKINLDDGQKKIMNTVFAEKEATQKALREEIVGLQQSGAGIVDINLAGLLKRPDQAANVLANAIPAPRLSVAAPVVNGEDPLGAAPAAAQKAPVAEKEPEQAPVPLIPAPVAEKEPEVLGNAFNANLDSPRPGMFSGIGLPAFLKRAAAPTTPAVAVTQEEPRDQELDLDGDVADVEQPSGLSRLFGWGRSTAPTTPALPVITTGPSVGNALNVSDIA